MLNATLFSTISAPATLKAARDYQVEAVDAFFEALPDPARRPLIEVPTGGGKSFIMAEIIRQAMEMDRHVRFLILAHVSELLIQNAEEINAHAPNAHVTFYSAKLGKKDMSGNVVCAGIQSIYKRAYDFKEPIDIILIDEAHLLSEDDDSMYRTFLDDMWKTNPNIRIGGLTASPFRANYGYLHKGKNALFTDIAYKISIGDLIQRGFLCPAITPLVQTKMDVTGVKIRAGDYIASQLSKAVDNDIVTKSCIDELLIHGADRKKWLIFCVDIKHAEHVCSEIQARGIKCSVMHSKKQGTENNAAMDKFKNGDMRCLVNVAMLTTGVNVPAIDLLGFMRPTRSPVLYLQCLDEKTEVLTSHGWKKNGEIKIGDVCASMDLKSNKGKWSRVKSVMSRKMNADENWISYKAPHLDFRVTGGHTMLISGRRGKYKKMTALDLYNRSDASYIPTSVEMDNIGVPLNDDELYLIGIIMTDGTVSGHQISISQSERHPYILKKIEDTLNNLKIDFAKIKIKTKPGDGSFKERFPRWAFAISAGKPRKGHKSSIHRFSREVFTGTGLRHLMPYLDKDFPSLLNQMSRSQFEIWLKGIYDGDGSKHLNADYNVQTINICSARKKFIDRVQALAVTLGYSCNFATEQGSRKNPIYYLHFKDLSRRSIAGQKQPPSVKRPIVKMDPATHENVWCVENEHGVIITRRNGRVAIMGNCTGRGLRTSPGKENCLILDWGNVVETLGPIDQLHIKEKQEGEGEAPIKYCEACGKSCAAGCAICPHCGAPFPDNGLNLDIKASNAAVLSSQLKPQILSVSNVSYYLHKKEGKPDSMRVDYLCGFETYREWVCLGHSGLPREKACAWWRRRSASAPPAGTAEALGRTSELTQPKEITVRKIGKYYEIIGETF